MTAKSYYCLLLLRDGRKKCLLYLKIPATLTGTRTPFFPPGLRLICLKREVDFISGYFVHLFLLLKIPYHLTQISGNQHPTQILSPGEFGGFFQDHVTGVFGFVNTSLKEESPRSQKHGIFPALLASSLRKQLLGSRYNDCRNACRQPTDLVCRCAQEYPNCLMLSYNSMSTVCRTTNYV